MNRRSFVTRFAKAVAIAAAAPTILPAATTYARRWVSQRGVVIDKNYRCIMIPPGPGSILHAQIWTPSPADLKELFDRYPLPGNVQIIENFSDEVVIATAAGSWPSLYDFLRKK